jgi:hypothetical protein
MTIAEPVGSSNTGLEHENVDPFHLGGCNGSPIGQISWINETSLLMFLLVP